MLRFSLALLLICASAQAMAQNGRGAPGNPGACQETEIVARENGDHAGSHSRASAARSKYARPSSSRTTTTGGGGDEVLPRTRGAKWHSFLPGMFR